MSTTKQVLVEFESDASTEEAWVVTHTTIHEQMSGPYTAEASIATHNTQFEPSFLLGLDCTLRVKREGLWHPIPGIVSSVAEGNSTQHELQLNIVIVPALWALSQTQQTRIFQEMTVPDILKEVLEAGLGDYGREVEFLLMEGTGESKGSMYPICEYRVQYNESNLAFCQRLMAEEGISYFFDLNGEKEKLVLSDADTDYTPVESEGSTIQYQPNVDNVRTHEVVHSFDLHSSMQPTKVSVQHFNWTKPSAGITGSSEPIEQGDGAVHGAGVDPERELYQHDYVPPTLSDYDDANGYQANDASEQAQLRWKAHAQLAQVYTGTSTALGLMPGAVLDLEGHPQPGLDGQYLVLNVNHAVTVEHNQEDTTYINHFRCIRASETCRPKRVERPRILGLQTATVVGPASDEIHTDVHGRIKVHFHWDRVESNEASSCYIRVMQTSAGAGWGTFFLPRIGMEVVVSFLDGNPDRPLVTGTVYNGENVPPYPMPDEKTKSTIKTQSSPGGKGYNELTFEDAAGSEQIIVHAQKDYNETVRNNHHTHVGGNQKNIVAGNQDEVVTKDQHLVVEANRQVDVTGTFTETIDGKVTTTINGGLDVQVTAGDEFRTITGNQSKKVTGYEWQIVEGELRQSISENVEQRIGGELYVDVKKSATQNVTKSLTVHTDDKYSLTAMKGVAVVGIPTIELNAPTEIILNAPKVTDTSASSLTKTLHKEEVVGSAMSVTGFTFSTTGASVSLHTGLAMDVKIVQIKEAQASVEKSTTDIKNTVTASIELMGLKLIG